MLFYSISHSHDCKSPACAVAQGYRSVIRRKKTRKNYLSLRWRRLSVLLYFCCPPPYEKRLYCRFLVPVFFIIFTLGVGKLRYPFLNLTWAVSTLCLLNYNQNFLQGVKPNIRWHFFFAVLISFSVCLLYMVRIYHRSEWLNRRWHLQALTDPLTLLPNFRALEQARSKRRARVFAACALIILSL